MPTIFVGIRAIACSAVAYADDFDDVPEEEDRSPLLPAEDRLWRHPSELGEGNGSIHVDPVAVRRRWLQSQPTRASAWTAGIVGALLATGLVALGTHLATAITNSPAAVTDDVHTTSSISTRSASSAAIGTPAMSVALASSITRISRSIVVVQAASGGVEHRALGLVVASDGYIVVPARDMANATSVIVDIPETGATDVGHLVGADPASGLAVVKIEGVHDLAVASLPAAEPVASSSLALVVAGPTPSAAELGVVRSADADDISTMDSIETDLSPTNAPLGSVLMDADGKIEGIVTATNKTGALATPSWLAAPVVAQLMSTGAVSHGWLGISGATASVGARKGVRVTALEAHSAAVDAGLHKDDVIVALNGLPVTSVGALRSRLYVQKPGAHVAITVLRDARRATLHAVLDG
jgi:S1-C subfamily serine protease